MILDLDDIGTEKRAEEHLPLLDSATSTNLAVAQESGHQGQVIMRVLHTRTELVIYPNGSSFVRNSSTWFEDKFYAPPAKKVKKKAETKEVNIDSVEEY
jgi:hypothetical protein